MSRKYLKDVEVAKIVNLSVQTLRNHRHRGVGLPYIKFGSAVRYLEEDIVRHGEEHRIVPSSENGPVK